ncbi:nucleoside hydrolase [Massilia orientalis]|uniref:Nucleoside hydrolase n=1 Tax=Massilia orientalis TaxID=3050128 RepID=A0ACC7M5Y0_9BURK|nr:nucleoside hydrolase [Massilia sp. YIM B02787]
MRDTAAPSLQRRAILRAGLAAAALGAARSTHALTASPRQRVIVDNDFSGDPDGLFQLAHHLASPSVEIPFVIGSHIHTGDFLDGSTRQPENAVAKVRELYATMRLPGQPPVIAGRGTALSNGELPDMTEVARGIIAEATRTDTKLPLYYAAGAGLTDLATALMLAPRISRNLKLVWIGGMEHGDLLPGVPPRHDAEYNLTIDTVAAQWVFNHSDVEIWQVPRNVYRQLIVSHAELGAGLRDAGKLGRFLIRQLERVTALMKDGLGETYILGDSPLVTLTALQSSFEPDSASSAYVVRPTPRLADDGRYVANPNGRPMRVYQTIDTRLTFADMVAKFAQVGRVQ